MKKRIDKNVVVLYGAAETAAHALADGGYKSAVAPFETEGGMRGVAVAGSTTKAALVRFASSCDFEPATLKGVAVLLFFYADATVFSVAPERLLEGEAATEMERILEEVASGLHELAPHYPDRDFAERHQAGLREKFAAIEPNLIALPKRNVAPSQVN